MRIASHIIFMFGLYALLSSLATYVPVATPTPHLASLSALYLGIVRGRNIGTSLFTALWVGLIAGLMLGAPRGVFPFITTVTCLVASAARGRVRLRAFFSTFNLSALAGLGTGLVTTAYLVVGGRWMHDLPSTATHIVLSALLTALIGPPLIFVFRRMDAACARTERDRLAALEGFPRS